MLFQNQLPKSSWKPTALVIDKDAETHRSIHVMLGKEYDVHHAYFPRLALSLLAKHRFNVVFTSMDMGADDDAPDLHRSIESISRDKGIPVIALTDALSTGETGCIHKPLEADRILAALRTALATRELAKEQKD